MSLANALPCILVKRGSTYLIPEKQTGFQNFLTAAQTFIIRQTRMTLDAS